MHLINTDDPKTFIGTGNFGESIVWSKKMINERSESGKGNLALKITKGFDKIIVIWLDRDKSDRGKIE